MSFSVYLSKDNSVCEENIAILIHYIPACIFFLDYQYLIYLLISKIHNLFLFRKEKILTHLQLAFTDFSSMSMEILLKWYICIQYEWAFFCSFNFFLSYKQTFLHLTKKVFKLIYLSLISKILAYLNQWNFKNTGITFQTGAMY